MNNNTTIQLLILDESLNDAEHASSAIRTLGYIIKATRVADFEELTKKIERNQYDICLFCLDSLSPTPFEDLLGTLIKYKKTLPVIALPSAKSQYDTAKLMRPGLWMLSIKVITIT